mmetsp:Transcript_78902/g.235165  ORF Transcript_78902/g.235165 Transcript_78902/m.235165 type:complete len:214 (+) Transcript_78902:341-982(+)
MNSCEVRVFGPAVANTSVPRLLLTFTGSSEMGLSRGCGLAGRPNCATKPGTTRKTPASSYHPCSTNFLNCAAPFGAHSGCTLIVMLASPGASPPRLRSSTTSKGAASSALAEFAPALTAGATTAAAAMENSRRPGPPSGAAALSAVLAAWASVWANRAGGRKLRPAVRQSPKTAAPRSRRLASRQSRCLADGRAMAADLRRGTQAGPALWFGA